MQKVIKFFYICFCILILVINGNSCNSNEQIELIPETCISPAVVVEPYSYEEAQNALETNNVEILIFSIDDFGVVSFSDGSYCSIDELYSQIEDAVPAVRVETSEQAVALSSYLQENGAVDFYVISSKSELIEKVKKNWSTVRGIYDASPCSFDDSDSGYEFAGEVCAMQSQVVILSSGVSRSFVREIQARSILVWIFTETETEIWNAALTGCYGILNNDISAMVSVLAQLEAVSLRSPYVVGHRGYPDKYNENSIEGVIGAFRAGATHVEIDVHLTADKEILVMHNSELDNTTNGTGIISDMTLDQIRQYKLNDNFSQVGYSEIPVLSDILNILQESEFSDKLLIIEIKDNSEELVTKISELLVSDKYREIRNRLMFITFNESLLENIAETMPDIPRGFLGDITSSDFLTRLSPTNSFIDIDVNNGLVNLSSMEMLKKYGYAAWVWTYQSGSIISTAYKTGVMGFTTNCAGDFSSCIVNIYMTSLVDESDLYDEISITVLRYDGTEINVGGVWKYINDNIGIIYYEYTNESAGIDIIYYTEPIVMPIL